ncbi:MAG: polysaccharide biosynthesis/export family protein [Chitinophagaceae bacterium]|nr:polysaccharide biosynthesis/export family protein [Chitinophagaceae bacterium]
MIREKLNVLPFLFVSIIVCFSSCVDTKKAAYFYGIGDTTILSPYNAVPEPVITRNDILTISVSSANPEADIPFNTPNTMASTQGGNLGALAQQTSGYLVNPEGIIQFPVLGNIKVGGMTKNEIKEMLTKELSDRKLLVDPVVNIRIINFRVTVMGEVRNPSVVSVPSEKMSLLEALGMAGDLTVYAKRDNVLLIREEGGQKVIRRINLNSQDLFKSPYYYLKSNDIVYVEANAARLGSAERSMQLAPLVLSSISVMAVVIGIILR